MPAVDLPLEQLKTLRLDEAPPDDLVPFWSDTVARARRHPALLSRRPIDSPLVLSETYDLTFGGFDGQPIRAWLQIPVGIDRPLPAVVQFQGYSTTRMIPLSSHWVESGFAHLQLDNRGQGWTSPSMHDLTPDADPEAGDNSVPGMMTRGIQSPETYYFRRLITDAVRLVDVARGLEEVDPAKVFVQGASQGGGLAIAAASITEMLGDRVAGAMPDVPFLCSFARAVDVSYGGAYAEIEAYLSVRPHEGARVMETLRYFDAVHMAPYATCPAYFSVGLRDHLCPPSTVFQAFNAWAGTQKEIEVYPWNQHEGGRGIQAWKQAAWAQRVIAG